MKKFIYTIIAASAATLPVAVTAAPAHADTFGCATRAEFGRVYKGMSMDRVTAILDTAGRREGFGYYAQNRYYRTCREGFAGITFERKAGVWRVYSKASTWY